MSDNSYNGAPMASRDPVARLAEIMRLLNESHLSSTLIRAGPPRAVCRHPRPNMLREDEGSPPNWL